MKNTKNKIIVLFISVFILIVVTLGVTYAVFTYTKLGTTENIITTGTLKFLYTENTGVGAGIKLENALPVSDSLGKSYITEGKVFDFTIEGSNTGSEIIPYEVTLRKKSNSTLTESAVKIYLTDMTEDADSELLAPTLYSNLTQTSIDVSEEVEKTIYTDYVTGGNTNYLKKLRLRMWIDENVNFGTGDYNNKTFTATVNVYSNLDLVSNIITNLENSTQVSSVKIGDVELTKVDEESHDYEGTLNEEVSNINIDVETENPNSSVSIEKVDNMTYKNYGVKRISATNTFSVSEGDNYFKVTILSENKKNKAEYYLKVYLDNGQLTLNKEIENRDIILKSPVLNNSSNNSNDTSGLYISTNTNDGNPTYYFRGDIDNNYVDFAGFIWRIVRINEDGTIRIILQDGINNNKTYKFNPNSTEYQYMYYSNSNVSEGAKYILEDWYKNNIGNNTNYSDKVASGKYFCESSKVSYSDSANSGNVDMTLYSKYIPTFKCEVDTNGYGLVNSNIGLLSYDEIIYAGGYFDSSNDKYFLTNKSIEWWTMSPAGIDWGTGYVWYLGGNGVIHQNILHNTMALRPVINLKNDTTFTGTGYISDPYKVN